MVKCTEPSNQIVIYYRSAEMKYPHLLYAEHPEYPDEVAVCASFVPTFEVPNPQEEFEVLEDEEPEQTVHSHGKDYLFMFIVDRSGSMSGRRIETAKEALKLFMRSLPVDSKFSIISFGDPRYEYMEIDGKTIIDYNDKNAQLAIAKIDTFKADFGMTEILKPIISA